MKKLLSVLALVLCALGVKAQNEDVTASLLEQYMQAKPLVVAPPANFNGKELPLSKSRKVTLTTVKSVGNDFGDEAVDAWYAKYGSGCPYREYWFGNMKETPETARFFNMPLTLGDLWRGTAEVHDGYCVFLYGTPDFPENQCGYNPYLAVVTNPEVTRIERVIDFRRVREAFAEKVVRMGGFSQYAVPQYTGYTFEGNTVYVCASHRTYSSSSGGKNAYLMAVDLTTGKIKWMTKPLTCNSQFVVTGNSIICGYGFSGEMHYVYVVDKNTGRRASKLVVKKSPELFSIMGNKVYSRMYAYDYTFNLKK